MALPPDFHFSQASLQDYADCPRRFQLRHLLRLAWPALEAEPALENERHMQQGAAFHRLAHQHALGIPPERLSSALTDADLRRWWHNYLERGPEGLPATRYPEVLLSAPLGSFRLIAKYDLIALDAGKQGMIVDWKTSRKRPKRSWLAERLQTKLYPYLLVRAGGHLNDGQPFEPEQVKMVYWFTEYPGDPARFAYDAAQHEADEGYLTSLIAEIERLGDEDFLLTTQGRHCTYCPYRSLCQRGVRAGAFDEMEEETELGDDADATDVGDFALDFEQIAEIEY
jgi:CRISPR/Cas system-associated exonuclease Cas4 (RecB family)